MFFVSLAFPRDNRLPFWLLLLGYLSFAFKLIPSGNIVFQMHPTRYPTDSARIGSVGTLLTSTILPWFAPLLEKKCPILDHFDAFIEEFQACFGDTDSVRTTINKIRRLWQGDRPFSTYTAYFRLLACDIPWDEEALMDPFRQGLCNDVKDLLFTFHEDPKSLIGAISRVVRCDNRLFEERSKHQQVSTSINANICIGDIVTYIWNNACSYFKNPISGPTLMEMNSTCVIKDL